MAEAGTKPRPRLLDPQSTAAVVLGAHDWTGAGLGRAPSFLRSARGIVAYLYDPAGLGLDPDLVLDLFDSGAAAGEQLAEIRDAINTRLRARRDAGRPVADLLIYYVGHGHTDDQGHLSLLVRRSHRSMEAETGIKAPDLARVLKLAAPQQRRVIVLDCCFSEAAARDFIGQSGALDQAVTAAAAKDLGDDQPRRGTLLLCSSPVGEVSMGPPDAERTLFTGALLDVLRLGVEGKPPTLSFTDLRDATFDRMVIGFGANAPRPVLHQVNAAQGDLTRTPAFPNRAPTSCSAARVPLPHAELPGPERTRTAAPDHSRSAEHFRLGRQREPENEQAEGFQVYALAADERDREALNRLQQINKQGPGESNEGLTGPLPSYQQASQGSGLSRLWTLTSPLARRKWLALGSVPAGLLLAAAVVFQQKPSPPRSKAVEPIFVVAPRGDDGTIIDTRTRAVLQAEGFRMASNRSEAGLLIEIAAPVLGPAETSPDSRLDIVTVTATLEARILAGTEDRTAPQIVRRQVRGRGSAEADARRDAIIRAADQLGERIAATLR